MAQLWNTNFSKKRTYRQIYCLRRYIGLQLLHISLFCASLYPFTGSRTVINEYWWWVDSSVPRGGNKIYRCIPSCLFCYWACLEASEMYCLSSALFFQNFQFSRCHQKISNLEKDHKKMWEVQMTSLLSIIFPFSTPLRFSLLSEIIYWPFL